MSKLSEETKKEIALFTADLDTHIARLEDRITNVEKSLDLGKDLRSLNTVLIAKVDLLWRIETLEEADAGDVDTIHATVRSLYENSQHLSVHCEPTCRLLFKDYFPL